MSSLKTLSSDSSFTLITGASSGIGAALAREFASHGHNLVLVGQNSSHLASLVAEITFPVKIIPITLDLTAKHAIDLLKEKLESENIFIEILINNAGVGVFGAFQETALDREIRMIELNILVLTRLTKLFLNDMTRYGRGNILNVASTTAFLPGPRMACYFATKAYVLSFSEALWQELDDSPIKVSILCPGPTRTTFQTRAGAEHLGSEKAWHVMSPEAVAKKAYQGLTKGKRLIIPGFHNWLVIFLVRFFPRPLLLKLIDHFQKHRKRL